MTYLSIVNNVLKRLRERTVSTVEENTYSTLISMFVNDAKQEVEQAWDWSALRTTLTATTTAGAFAYELTGAGDNMKMLDVVNDTSNVFMTYKTASDFNNYYLNSNPTQGSPRYYSFNGIDNNGDTIVEIFPPPDGTYLIRFNLINRQDDLATDTDVLLCPSKPVEMLAYAKAVEERGEDGGVAGVSAYRTAERALSDAIALDAAKHPEEVIWTTP
jgi:hypothetical protein